MWGPTYNNSYAICISTGGFSIVILAIVKIYLERENRRMDALSDGDPKKKKWRYIS